MIKTILRQYHLLLFVIVFVGTPYSSVNATGGPHYEPPSVVYYDLEFVSEGSGSGPELICITPGSNCSSVTFHSAED